MFFKTLACIDHVVYLRQKIIILIIAQDFDLIAISDAFLFI